MTITANFTLEELTYSDYATRNNIKNVPTAGIILGLTDTCTYILEPLRKAIKKPIRINSGYRSKSLNKAIGGSSSSQHCLGQAVDIIVPGMTVEELFQKIIDLKLPYDQIIQEFSTWIHVSYRANGRGQKLRAIKKGGKTVYNLVN